jgi:hypothetical protein
MVLRPLLKICSYFGGKPDLFLFLQWLALSVNVENKRALLFQRIGRRNAFRYSQSLGIIWEGKMKFSSIALSAALFVSTLSVTPAKAAIELTLSDSGGDNVTTTAPTSASGFSSVFLSQMLPNSGIVVNWANGTAESAPYATKLQLGSFSVATTDAATLTIGLSADGFTQQGFTGFQEDLGVTLTNATVTLTGYEGSGLFDETNAGPPLSLPTAESASAGTKNAGPITFGSSFSLTEVATIVFGAGGGQINLAGTITPTPEPASLVLFGTILAGFGLVIRKRLQTR